MSLSINDAMFFQFIFEGYRQSDSNTHTGNTNIMYYGYVNKQGAYYIIKQTRSGNAVSYRFLKGDSGYTTAWAAREAGSYDYFNTIFA